MTEPIRLRSARRVAARSRADERGIVLPIVLLIAALMLATSAAWFETSLAAARGASNVLDYLQAFHAADSALELCARNALATDAAEATQEQQQQQQQTAEASNQTAAESTAEPADWKQRTAFEARATTPVAQWPGSQRAPQCLIEPWRLAHRTGARAYLLTSRGFGSTRDTQVWLQMQLVIDGATVERHWRRVAASPF